MEAFLVAVPRQREYLLKPETSAKVLDRRNTRKKGGKVGSRVVSAAYQRLVAPFFARHEPSRAGFIAHTVPYLVRNTSPAVTAILSGVWFRKHGKGHYGAFIGEVMREVQQCSPGPRYAQLRTQRQREAMGVICHLSTLKDGPLLLPARELQLRLLLPDPMCAWRVIQQLVALRVIEVVDLGISRPEASKLGVKAVAATYRLTA